MAQAILNGKYVDSSEIDPSIHKFIGTFRFPQPPSGEYIDKVTGETKRAGYISCPCGHMLGYVEHVRDHWQQGHFDINQYETI